MAEPDKPRLAAMAEGIIKIYNEMGCRVMNVGANDLALGAGFINHIKDLAEFPLISANILVKATQQHAFEPYIILNTGDQRIGVIGVSMDTPQVSEQFEFGDPVVHTQAIVDAITADTDVIIVLASLDDRKTQQLADQVQGADFVVSSRSLRVSSQLKTKGSTTVIQNGTRGKYAGVLHVKRADNLGTIRNLTPEYSQLRFTRERLDALSKPVPAGMTLIEYYAGDGAKTQLVQRLEAQKNQREKIIHETANYFWFLPVALSEEVLDNPEILMQVEALKRQVETAASSR
ncbi:MAG: hypothetical protein K9N11_04495 [Lentisphaeria bacterium]|nr:hypothetical protein [Candidatus Neomarinimicrobiota bacterium]MCF7842094.1 hypothetical protein [Lentisphaeria bacterium]